MNIKKTIGIILFIPGTISLLAWPLLAYSSIFLFDAPLTDKLDGNLRSLSVLLVLSYPIGYLAAILWFIINWRNGKLKFIHCLSGLTPIIHLSLALVITDQIMEYQHDRKNPDISITEDIIIEDRGPDQYVINKQGDVLVDRDIDAHHYLEEKNILLVAKSEVGSLELEGGSTIDVYSADDPISYFVINTLDSSVSGGFSREQIKDQYDLPDDLELFEPEARRDEFIKNNPDIHEAHERKRNKDF